jgi:hypothetical protein
MSVCLLTAAVAQSEVLYQDCFDNDMQAANTGGIGGGAVNRTIEAYAWTDDGEATLVASGTDSVERALMPMKPIRTMRIPTETAATILPNCA